jgi:hypothetical protein
MTSPVTTRAQLVAALDRTDCATALLAQAAATADHVRQVALLREALRLATAGVALIGDMVGNRLARPGGLGWSSPQIRVAKCASGT